MNNKSKKTGFTLIELMVVVTIIAILGALGIASYRQANQSARDAKRRSDLETVKQALILYRQEVGNYPNVGSPNSNGRYNSMVSTLVSAGYLSNPSPVDPRNTGTMTYQASGVVSGTTSTFCICADLETNRGNSTTQANCSAISSTTTTGGFYCVRQP